MNKKVATYEEWNLIDLEDFGQKLCNPAIFPKQTFVELSYSFDRTQLGEYAKF